MVAAGVVTELTVENGGLQDTTEDKEEIRREEKRKHLAKMGAMTGLAIALHNFPEGLATFVATLADSSTGLAIAIAIALHNIPEGVCVAMPIYYATGSKWKGFWWAFLSGVSEPIGGLMGYLVRAAFPFHAVPLPSMPFVRRDR
jgi:ZIP family zinc transporter